MYSRKKAKTGFRKLEYLYFLHGGLKWIKLLNNDLIHLNRIPSPDDPSQTIIQPLDFHVEVDQRAFVYFKYGQMDKYGKLNGFGWKIRF